jgi:hypothetical protein
MATGRRSDQRANSGFGTNGTLLPGFVTNFAGTEVTSDAGCKSTGDDAMCPFRRCLQGQSPLTAADRRSFRPASRRRKTRPSSTDSGWQSNLRKSMSATDLPARAANKKGATLVAPILF